MFWTILINNFFCSREKLQAIATYLHLVPSHEKAKDAEWCRLDEEFLRELLVKFF